jgi:hypothetical protein
VQIGRIKRRGSRQPGHVPGLGGLIAQVAPRPICQVRRLVLTGSATLRLAALFTGPPGAFFTLLNLGSQRGNITPDFTGSF